MSVAIIGTGNMAKGFARLLAARDAEFAIGARDPAKAASLAAAVGGKAQGGGIEAAVHLADIIILAVPFGAVGDIVKSAGGLDGKIVVDITNPITPDYMSLTIGHTTSAGEEIQKLAPGARVVKAFNTIFAEIMQARPADGNRVQVFYATDDAEAGAAVAGLISSLGFEPVASGGLTNSRYLEPRIWSRWAN